jgi:RNA polymerase sigma factor (sigma-70 family)
MPDASDMDLVQEFVRQGSEAAFAELVHRHLNLVYSVAMRFTSNPEDSQDVAQAVFIILAKKAARLRQGTVLTGWLYETTRFTACRFLRTEARRRAREQQAYMRSTLNEPDTAGVWQQLAPHLEAAMSRLREADRTLLALRFYQHKTGSEAAALLGTRADAAHKRTARALETLRTFFYRRGITLSAAAIAGALSAESVQAAPAGLANTIAGAAVTQGAAAGSSTLTLVKGAIKLMAWAKAKTAIVAGVGVLLAAGTATVAVRGIQARNQDPRLGYWGVGFSPDGKVLATVGGPPDSNETPRLGELIFWDLATGQKRRVIRHPWGIRSLAWAPNGKFIAIGDVAGATQLVRPGTGTPIVRLRPHSEGVNAVAISADSQLVASGSLDGTVTLWDASRKKLEPLALPGDEQVISLALSPDGRALVAGGRRGRVYLVDLTERGEPRVVEAGPASEVGASAVEAVAFAPDGRSFATGCGRALRFWEHASGSLRRDLRLSTGNVQALAFSPGGEALAVLDSNGTLSLWSSDTYEPLYSATAHGTGGFGLAFSPDGKRIATVGRSDFTLNLWDAQTLMLRGALGQK